jgi:acetylornithine deacetylase/succinyl-diaminopimelate desuccinylase-like protein
MNSVARPQVWKLRDLLAALALVGSACAKATLVPRAASKPESAPAAVAAPRVDEADCARALTLESSAISAEVSCLLRRYVQIETVNPPGGELAGARWLERVLARDGIPAEVVEPQPGRANLMARLPGADHCHAILLVHHMDVVPAAADEWSVPPFAGLERDGTIWGRGSLDNKGGGVAELETLLLLKRLGAQLNRDVVLLAVADEEAGGKWGARWVTEQHRQWLEGVEFVLNEGGAILDLGTRQQVYSVELAQKAPLWLRVTARGTSGHGAAPTPGSAVSVLIRALNRLSDYNFPLLVLPEVQRMLAARARALPAAEQAMFQDLKKSLDDPAFRERLLSDPRDAALVRNTVAITQLFASDKENVVSGQASAVLDVRLLPGQEPATAARELLRVMAEPSLELQTLLTWQAHTSTADTAMFRAIEQLAHARDPAASVSPTVIGGFTDCNAFRAIGLTCYGFLPLRLRPADLAGVHGKDERVRVEVVSAAVADLYDLLHRL